MGDQATGGAEGKGRRVLTEARAATWSGERYASPGVAGVCGLQDAVDVGPVLLGNLSELVGQAEHCVSKGVQTEFGELRFHRRHVEAELLAVESLEEPRRDLSSRRIIRADDLREIVHVRERSAL